MTTKQILTPWDEEQAELEDGRSFLLQHPFHYHLKELHLLIQGYHQAVADYTCPFCGRLRQPGEDCICQEREMIP